MIRIEDFQCEGLLPILEAFPTYRSAINFVMTFRPSFIKSPQNQALVNHFTEYLVEYFSESRIEYFEEGCTRSERWLLDGEIHRNDGPASILYYENGQIKTEA